LFALSWIIAYQKLKVSVSGHQATAESARFQLKQPLRRMQSFAYLSHGGVEGIIASYTL